MFMRIIFFLSFFLFSFATTISAHTSEMDGNIGATLHIDPADAPIAKSPSTFSFEFHDSENTFTPSECDCTFVVLHDGKEIYTQNSLEVSTYPYEAFLSTQYTFSHIGIYTIQMHGQPKTEGLFSPFQLQYTVRVEHEAEESTSPESQTIGLEYIMLGCMLVCGTLVFIVCLVVFTIKQKRSV